MAEDRDKPPSVPQNIWLSSMDGSSVSMIVDHGFLSISLASVMCTLRAWPARNNQPARLMAMVKENRSEYPWHSNSQAKWDCCQKGP